MSAFVVSMSTMDRVVRSILAIGEYGHIVRQFNFIRTETNDAGTQIGRQLFGLNCEAVMQRYPDCRANPDNMPGWQGCAAMPLTYRYHGTPHRLDRPRLIDGYKAMRCLIYQCSEGTADTLPEYVALQAAAGDVAYAIVASLPEYDAAPWGR